LFFLLLVRFREFLILFPPHQNAIDESFVDVYRADGVPFSLSKQLLGEDRVRIRMTTPRRGYVSVGWAPSSVSVAHKQMDTVVGWLDESTGKVVVIDAFSDAKSAAKDDVKLAMGANNIVDPTGSFSDADGLVIEFTRLRNTGDPNDQVFAPNASVFLQWAVHDKPCTAAFVCAKHTSGNAAIVGNVDMLAQLAPSGPVEPAAATVRRFAGGRHSPHHCRHLSCARHSRALALQVSSLSLLSPSVPGAVGSHQRRRHARSSRSRRR
jgi:hypothetical protein